MTPSSYISMVPSKKDYINLSNKKKNIRTIEFVIILSVFLSVGLIFYGLVISVQYDEKIKLGDCYDSHSSKIQGLTCEVKDTQGGLLMSLGLVLSIFFILILGLRSIILESYYRRPKIKHSTIVYNNTNKKEVKS